ncbi:hypothetical protein DES53_103408 [Roseimicrobium gellanilyticum]|uniref:Uncharacterized protein n=1 Tax=Roseimicrobium gellanilyticum TaxID=748857 RepID=A0A366HRK8_9BACT|nr:hypothetical protein [Roseimicrobium gellanilyticum]RBP45409.1 hypothetical protein DES53_103408 [Roseimicrobium gellanilyticum]
MKTLNKLSRIAGIAICVLGSGCDGPPPSPAAPLEALSPTIQQGGRVASKTAEIDFTRLESSPLENLEKELWSGNADEANTILFELTRRRTDEGCRLMIKFLREQSAQLPKDLPSMEEMKKLEAEYHVTRKRPTGNHWSQTLGKATAAARRLVELDMPTADQAAKEFREELAVKWKGSEGGTLFLNLIQMEYEQAKEGVRTGAVPWSPPK